MSSASGTIGSAWEVGEDFGERFDHRIIVRCIIASYAQDLSKSLVFIVRFFFIFGYLFGYSKVIQNLCECSSQSFPGMRSCNLDDVQEKAHWTAVVLEMHCLSNKRTIIGGSPGVRSKTQSSIVFLSCGECAITILGLKDLLGAFLQYVP